MGILRRYERWHDSKDGTIGWLLLLVTLHGVADASRDDPLSVVLAAGFGIWFVVHVGGALWRGYRARHLDAAHPAN